MNIHYQCCISLHNVALALLAYLDKRWQMNIIGERISSSSVQTSLLTMAQLHIDPVLHLFYKRAHLGMVKVRRLFVEYPPNAEDLIHQLPELTIELILSQDSKIFDELRCCFYGVRQLELKPGFGNGHFLLLEIIDMSGDQWEDVRFKVLDAEDGGISFLCSTFKILSMAN